MAVDACEAGETSIDSQSGTMSQFMLDLASSEGWQMMGKGESSNV